MLWECPYQILFFWKNNIGKLAAPQPIKGLSRANNIASEIYLDQNKNLKKQLQYADRKKLNFAIICGENEFKDEKLTIKKLNSSKENDQLVINRKDLVNEISKLQ